jgi:hypothetical protein
MRLNIFLITKAALIVFAPSAHAHWGHVGEVAGHGHIIGIGALAAAAALAAALAAARGKRAEQAEDDDEETSAEGEAA